MNKGSLMFPILFLLFGCILGGGSLMESYENKTNHYKPYPEVTNIENGISWPEGQALPTFATPEDTLDTILVQAFTTDEAITFSALQGLVNKEKPRILLLDSSTDEGAFTWPMTPIIGFENRETYLETTKFDLLAKYADEVDGVILYDPTISPHYRNLAGTMAGIMNAIPVAESVHEKMEAKGIELDVVEDLTEMTFTTPIEIYNYLYDNYWGDTQKRVILNAKPYDEGGDHHHTRDIIAATGETVLWLDTLDDDEREVLEKFYGDMEPGNAIALGWYTTERSGITLASKFGIGTMPADFYISGSVYSGNDNTITPPPVPNKPELENKVYIALYISDGDNIQYTQRAMRVIWDENEDYRGQIPMNWTIAPGLVDIGPGLLNYYYQDATENEYFVTGPSGMGYMMPYNTLNEPGAPVKDILTDEGAADGYTRLTETYLQRSGIRVVTIWDDASPMVREAYERNSRNLYGATVQNFRDVPSVAGSIENDRVPFEKLRIPYGSGYDHIFGDMTSEINKWDGESPYFLSYQVDIWSELRPEVIIEIHDKLNEQYDGNVEFVRADHFFALYNEANHLPFNLAMSEDTTVTASDTTVDPKVTINGTFADIWSSSEEENWLEFDFSETYEINRYVIRHAGEHSLDQKLNTRDYRVEVSTDGSTWELVDDYRGNQLNVTDIEFDPVEARYLRLTIDNPGADDTARIANVEIYGRVVD